jgi:hypothetical protein
VIATLVCSLLLWFPGHALLGRLGAHEPAAGVLGALGRGYAASLLLLSPLSLACYALHAPLWVFSAGLALLVLWGLVVCARDRASLSGLGVAFERWEWCGLALLAAHLVLAARVGGWLDGDATFHVGRMRWLIEHGFSNRDIYTRDDFFQHVYHSNLLYPLYASFAQLTGQGFLDSWFQLLPLAKLTSFAAHGYLGYRLASRRWVGWATAVLAEAARAPETYTLYPNGMAVGFLLPLALAVGVGAPLGTGGGRQSALELGALSLLLGQVHGLYALYAGLCVGSALALRMALGSAAVRRALVPCVLALAAASPFLLVSRYAFIPAAPADAQWLATPALPPKAPARAKANTENPALTPALAHGGGNLEKQLEARSDGSYVMPPLRMGGAVPLLVGLLALGACLAFDGARRLDWLALSAPVTLLGVTLLVPALCTLAVRLLQEPFAVARLSTVLNTALFAACAGALGLLLERAPRAAWLSALGLVGCALLGSQLLGHAPRSFGEHWRAALTGQSEARAQLVEHGLRRRFLASHVPPGSSVLTTPRLARYVAMVFDARVVAADRSQTHVPGLDRLRHEASLMTAKKTAPALRNALLAKHRIRWVAYRDKDRAAHAWAEALGRHLGQAGALHLVDLGERFAP